MTSRTAIWLLVMAIALTGSCAFGDLLTVKHAHGELKLEGLIKVYYAEFEDDAMVDTFELRRGHVWLCVSGSVYDKIDFAALAMLDHNPTLLDAWIKLKYIPHVDVTVGQFWKPVTYEALTSTAKLPFVYYAVPNQFLMMMGIVSRDIGAKATFHYEKEDYTMLLLEGGVFNGTGIGQSDNNDQKDYVFRACLQPTKGVEFFGNYTYGTYGEKLAVRTSPMFGHEEYEQYSGGLAIDYEGVDIVGEWMGVRMDYLHNWYTTNPASVGYIGDDECWNGYGWYIHAGYKIDTGYDYFHKVEPIVRYEYLDPNSDKHVINDLSRLVTYGLNVWIDQKYAKLQINYIWNIDDSGPGQEVADNIFVAQLQGAF